MPQPIHISPTYIVHQRTCQKSVFLFPNFTFFSHSTYKTQLEGGGIQPFLSKHRGCGIILLRTSGNLIHQQFQNFAKISPFFKSIRRYMSNSVALSILPLIDCTNEPRQPWTNFANFCWQLAKKVWLHQKTLEKNGELKLTFLLSTPSISTRKKLILCLTSKVCTL